MRVVEQVYNCHYDTAGNYHWIGVHTGEHIERNDEKMSDLISRQEAVEYFMTNTNWHDEDGYTIEDAEEKRTLLTDYFDGVPSANQWISCSERLPEDIKPVIVTWKNTDPEPYYQNIVGKHFIGAAHYKDGEWFWYSSVTEDLLAEYGRCDSEKFDKAIEVVAWQPLPDPWKGVQE